MAGLLSAVFGHHEEGDLSPLRMSDEEILEKIYITHVHSTTTPEDTRLFDVNNLFFHVDNILTRTTDFVETTFQFQARPKILSVRIKSSHEDHFASPVCTLKQISSEMTCKAAGEDVCHRTTLSILEKLSHYEWDAKAVLTLAAFAMDYGEIWLLAQNQQENVLARSLAVLKRVSHLIITNPPGQNEYRQQVVEINNIIKSTLLVIEVILELKTIKVTHDIKDVPALTDVMDKNPVDVYWVIITIVATATQINCLTCKSEKKQELSHFGQKVNFILSKLKQQLTLCRAQIEDVEEYRRLKTAFQTPTEIMDVLKVLLFRGDGQDRIFCGSKRTSVSIEVLRRKDVLLFISSLDITDDDFAHLMPIHDELKKNDQYKIVWVPVVDNWTDELRRKFENLKSKMPWYVVTNFTSSVGIKFIHKEWRFRGKPIVVTLSPQGKVMHPNAIHMINLWGIKGFPFTSAKEEEAKNDAGWIQIVSSGIHSIIPTWLKQEKYIFFYGGSNNEWIQEFTKYATALSQDTFIKESGVSIELFCVGKTEKIEEDNILSRFWKGVESLFVSNVHKVDHPMTQEVKKLLSYKYETGWALLSKGSTAVLSGHGITISKTLEEFTKWKEFVPKHGFEVAFKEYHDKVVKTIHRCSRIEVPNASGKLPKRIPCPECPKQMEIFVSYKCCHNESSVNGPPR